jgi:hypothetical protein
MNLVPCRTCDAEVSPEAAACPRCGAPFPAHPSWQGRGFEWRSVTTIMGYPLVHIAVGRTKEGKILVAKGIIAIGQFAVGMVAIAQFGFGLLFGFGQFILGCTALAQFAGALLAGVGQFATGYVAVGQVVLGYYGLAQAGLAQHLWTVSHKDPQAVEFFLSLKNNLTQFFSW